MGASSTAQAAPGDASLGVKAGTLGVGLELTMEAIENVNLRFGANYFKFGTEVEIRIMTMILI